MEGTSKPSKFPTIKSSYFSYDMGPWLCEKSEYAARSLVDFYENIRNRNDLPDGLLKESRSYLAASIYDLTKVISFASGGEWSPEDTKLILDNGKDGLEEILFKYGLLKETTKQRIAREQLERENKLKELAHNIMVSFSKPRGEARPYINELIDHIGIKHPFVTCVSELTDK